MVFERYDRTGIRFLKSKVRFPIILLDLNRIAAWLLKIEINDCFVMSYCVADDQDVFGGVDLYHGTDE